MRSKQTSQIVLLVYTYGSKSLDFIMKITTLKRQLQFSPYLSDFKNLCKKAQKSIETLMDLFARWVSDNNID